MTIEASFKIGVTDSGVGGLTVVQELQRQLPGEDLLYFGDSRNCPYGNKDRQTLVSLTTGMISTLAKGGLKLNALACNTTSPLAEEIAPCFPFPIFSVIEPICRAVALSGAESVGVLATVFTTQSGSYPEQIHRAAPGMVVYSQASPHLAALVDEGDLDSPLLREEIKDCMDALLAQGKMDRVILGCTHYPIVGHLFRELYPDITFLNPAAEQVKAIRRWLEEHDLLNRQERGSFSLYTTGQPEVYEATCRLLGITPPNGII